MDVGNNREDQKVKSINIWKFLFIILLAIIVGTIIFLFIRVNAVREPNLPEMLNEIEQTDATFQVELNKTQTNAIVNNFLTNYQKDSSVKFEFIVEMQALLTGNFKFLGENLKFYIYFNPTVEDNGDITLKTTSISIGELKLPAPELLTYVSSSYDLPDWVEVRSEESSIVIHLSQFKPAPNMRISADKIDLIDDEILFTVSLY